MDKQTNGDPFVRYRLNCVSVKGQEEVLTPMWSDLEIVFTQQLKMRLGGWALIQSDWCPKNVREIQTRTQKEDTVGRHTQETHTWIWSRGWSCAATSQGTPGAGRSQGRAGHRRCLTVLIKNQPCGPLEVRLLASSTERQSHCWSGHLAGGPSLTAALGKTHLLPEWLVSVTQRVRLCNPTDWTYQASLSIEFSRQGYWSRLPFPSPPYIIILLSNKKERVTDTYNNMDESQDHKCERNQTQNATYCIHLRDIQQKTKLWTQDTSVVARGWDWGKLIT